MNFLMEFHIADGYFFYFIFHFSKGLFISVDIWYILIVPCMQWTSKVISFHKYELSKIKAKFTLKESINIVAQKFSLKS